MVKMIINIAQNTQGKHDKPKVEGEQKRLEGDEIQKKSAADARKCIVGRGAENQNKTKSIE